MSIFMPKRTSGGGNNKGGSQSQVDDATYNMLCNVQHNATQAADYAETFQRRCSVKELRHIAVLAKKVADGKAPLSEFQQALRAVHVNVTAASGAGHDYGLSIKRMQGKAH
jgi:hypothetical protein